MEKRPVRRTGKACALERTKRIERSKCEWERDGKEEVISIYKEGAPR